jgi:hypothetical protein
MNWDESKKIGGCSSARIGRIRASSDDNVELANGKRSALLGLLQTRYGHAKEQAERKSICGSSSSSNVSPRPPSWSRREPTSSMFQSP